MDFVKWAEQFLGPEQELLKLKYFSAPPFETGKQKRQAILFKVNQKLNPGRFEVIRGKYYKKNHYCPTKKS